MTDLDFQQLSSVQNELQQKPVTLASATILNPTTFITHISGTVGLETINPPVTGSHSLIFIFNNATPTVNVITGNIVKAVTPIQNEPVLAVYDPISGSYYLGNMTS